MTDDNPKNDCKELDLNDAKKKCEELSSSLIETFYGLKVEVLQKINGYDDLNFFVQVSSQYNNDYIGQLNDSGYIFKIMNEDISKNVELIDALHRVMFRLSSNGLIVPIPVKDKEGNTRPWHLLELPKSLLESGPSVNERSKRALCLLQFIPGQLMKTLPYTEQLLMSVGSTAGKLYSSLKEFSDDAIKQRHYIWNLSLFPEVSNFFPYVKDPSRLSLIREVMEGWLIFVVPVLPSLEKGVIHGDLNEQNLLASSRDGVFGVLDFGDVSFCPVIFDLAIAICYVLVEVTSFDLLRAALYVIRGYQMHRPILDVEWNILKECIAARMAQSLMLGAYFFSKDPSNVYILGSAERCWEVLEKFWSIPKDRMITFLKGS